MPAPTDTIKGRRMRAHLADLRALRETKPSVEDLLTQALDIIEALAKHLHADQTSDRKRGNERRLQCVEALQFASKARGRKVDIEI
jgi:hypothetical protein